MDLLHQNLGFSHVSIYLVDDDKLRLGAQRGYDHPIETFDGSVGVIGRVIRNRRAELVTDLAHDPDFVDVAGDVTSEICAPLLSDDELLGVVNVETTRGALDETDLGSVLLVADRLASALALARERRSLAERVELFQRLTEFGASVTGSLDAATLYPAIVDGVRKVLDSDIAVLTVLDRATGRYFIRAMSGGGRHELRRGRDPSRRGRRRTGDPRADRGRRRPLHPRALPRRSPRGDGRPIRWSRSACRSSGTAWSSAP